MSDLVTLELWLHPDGRHSWRDPRSQWYHAPAGAWKRHGEIRVRRWGEDTGILPQDARKLPKGAILASTLRQNCGMGGPHYFYRDIQATCRACRADFIFSAGEQKHWFEELMLWNEIIPRECRDCRRRKHHDRISHTRLAEAIRRLKVDPDDEDAHLQAARATALLAERIGMPALERGVGFARRAARRRDLAARAKEFEETIVGEIEARRAVSHSRLP